MKSVLRLLFLLLIVTSFTAQAETITLKANRIDSDHIKISWRISKLSVSESNPLLRIEKQTTLLRFKTIKKVTASRRGSVKTPLSSLDEAKYRATLVKKTRPFAHSPVIVVLSDIPQGQTTDQPGTSDSPSTSSGQQTVDISLHSGESLCPNNIADSVLNLIEQHRADLRLPALKRDPALEIAAQLHSLKMLRINSMTHDNWYEEAIQSGYNPLFLAQNIAYRFNDPSSVVAAWLASQGHRMNIENPRGVDTGISCVQDVPEFTGGRSILGILISKKAT